MSDDKPESDLSAELRELGRNLKTAAKTAWQSEESRRLQQELKAGMAALEAGLREAGADIQSGETGQRIRKEADDFRERVRTGEMETRLRTDLLSALRTVNAELKKAAQPTDKPNDKA